MSRAVGQRLWALMSAGAASSAGLVMTANGLASLAIGIYLAMEVEVPLLWSLAVVVVAFVFLTGCLLDRRMVWIATVLGGAINAGIGAFVLAAMSENLHPKAPWVAAPWASCWAFAPRSGSTATPPASPGATTE